MRKKTLVFIIAALLLLCSCGNKAQTTQSVNISESDYENQIEISKSSAPSIKENKINELGQNAKYFLNKYGEITDSDWIDGPIYKFAENENWYAFSEYDFDENENYIPLGTCTHIFMTFGDLISSPDKEYDIDVFEEAVSKKIVMYYNEMDMINIYEASYKKFKIELSETPGKGINEDSPVVITLR